MIEKAYTFGSTIAKKLDYFAFPRTGSHYLWACFTGLFDLVFYENEYTYLPEAIQRFEELNPLSCYSLKLRQDGVPFQPVCIEAKPNGLHGEPCPSNTPAIILIRNPHSTIYSLFKTAKDRWNYKNEESKNSIQEQYDKYREFYKAAFEISFSNKHPSLIVRYEELIGSQEPLEKIVEFIGVTPKLNCEFVRHWTDFERMTNDGKRTFYRQGDDQAWEKDPEWRDLVLGAEVGKFDEFGY